MFEPIRPYVQALEAAYKDEDEDAVDLARATLSEACVALAGDSLGGGENCTAAAAGFVRMNEMATKHTLAAPGLRTIVTWRLLAAFLFFHAGRQGSASSLLRGIDISLAWREPRNAERLMAQGVIDFMTKTTGADQEARRGIQLAKETTQTLAYGADVDTKDLADALEIEIYPVAVRFLDGISKIARASLTNAEDGWTQAYEAFQDAEALARASSPGHVQVLCSVFLHAAARLRALSIFNLVDRWWPTTAPKLAKGWLTHRVEAGRPFLFPGQADVLLQQGALDNSPSIVSMPTGAGKSLLAELHALKVLSKNAGALVIVVEPSRALCAEKRQELQDGLAWDQSGVAVHQLTGEISVDDAEVVQDASVLVVTPEKLDAMLRAGAFAERGPDALIVDEFHLIRRGARGLRLQVTIDHCLALFPALERLFISAIVRRSDLAALSEWASSPTPFESEWRPTPTRIGLVHVEPRELMPIEFSDGTTAEVGQVQEGAKWNAVKSARRRIARHFANEDQLLQFELSWRKPFNDAENGLMDEAAALIDEGFSLPEYCDRTKWQAALREISRLAGKTDPIVKAFASGIAVHWGDLPFPARKILEQAIRDKAVGIVLTTSTLAEGVNLPVRTVFVPRVETISRPLERATYLNVIGRAGRPFFHPEGQVIVGYDYARAKLEDREARKRHAEEFIQTSRNEVEPLVTSLVDFATRIDQLEQLEGWDEATLSLTEERLDELPEIFAIDTRAQLARAKDLEYMTSAMLSAVHLASALGDSRPLTERLLLGSESVEERSMVERAVNFLVTRLARLGAIEITEGGPRPTSWGETVFQIGLGPQSCLRLRQFFLDTIAGLGPASLHPSTVFNKGAEIGTVLAAIWRPIEFLEPPSGRTRDKFLFRGWIGGAPLAESAKRFKGGIPYLEALTRVDSRLAGQAGWVFLALAKLAEEVGQEVFVEPLNRMRDASLFGHHDPRTLSLLKMNEAGAVLRDDILALRWDLIQRGYPRERTSPEDLQAIWKATEGLRGDPVAFVEAFGA